jgi:hypothetical protein
MGQIQKPLVPSWLGYDTRLGPEIMGSNRFYAQTSYVRAFQSQPLAIWKFRESEHPLDDFPQNGARNGELEPRGIRFLFEMLTGKILCKKLKSGI